MRPLVAQSLDAIEGMAEHCAEERSLIWSRWTCSHGRIVADVATNC
jgi:hypothetical protein